MKKTVAIILTCILFVTCFLLSGCQKGSKEDSFPKLPNPDPDWEGKYDWSRAYDNYIGPELYLRYSVESDSGNEYGYLVKGETWNHYDPDSPLAEGPEDGSLRYDKATNTLTLNNFKGSLIEANLMGNAFKIKVLGDNQVDFIRIWGSGYSGSVTFTGNGKLAVGRKINSEEEYYEGGIALIGDMGVTEEFGSACLIVDREVTLDVHGSPAITIESTAMEKAIYYLDPITMTGGTILVQSSQEDRPNEPDNHEPVCYNVTIADDDGNPSSHVVFAPGM